MTHSHQVHLRQERINLINSQIRRKETDKIAILRAKLIENERVEQKICDMMSENSVSEAQHEHFAKCIGEELKSFILARRDNAIKSKLPNKGKIADAIRGEHNLISMAFDSRSMPNVLTDKLKKVEENELSIGVVNEDETNTFSRHAVIVEIRKITTKASAYLQNVEWIDSVKKVFDTSSIKRMNDVSEDCYSKADNLQKILLSRLTNHIRRRIQEKQKMEHWCLQWAASNFAQMSALIVLSDHVKEDISCLDNNATLLKTAIFFVKVEGDEIVKQGAYLHYDNNDGKWIRSGKVTGRGFTIRQAEHLKKAKAKSATSRFYLRYPTKCSARSASTSRKGYFDNLTQYVALGFAVGNEEVNKVISSDFEEGGIFIYDNVNKRINATNKAGRNTTALKRIDVIAYLIELVYDLAISPVDNVSENPGFESCLNIY